MMADDEAQVPDPPKRQKRILDRYFQEIGRWQRDEHSDDSIDSFIRRELKIINDRASFTFMP